MSVILSLSGQYNISGSIVDDENNLPLTGATIVISDSNKGAVSNIEGKYTVNDLPSGDHSLTVSFIGMETRILLVTIADEDIVVDFVLKEDSEYLEEIVVRGAYQATGLQRLRAVENNAIFASKKNELIQLEQLTINQASNLSRQIYAKIVGLNIWESDGAGVQLGIGGRGLSPNRNSNFNTRQNGYDISADALGYPESYYSPPAEAIERIEVVRGAASLQFGTQFGGMLNFRFKKGPLDKKIEIHSRQTLGSFGFYNSYNSVGGTIGKLNYYGFYQYKKADGWRPNSSLSQHTAYWNGQLAISDKFQIKIDLTHSNYLAQQPGGLTDAEFELDPRQSKRERNWFAVYWNLAAVEWDWKLSEKTKINSRTFGLYAGRDALGNLENINLLDFGENRDFLRDEFRNWGNETRLIHRYETFNQPATLLLGTRYYKGRTFRKQGEGSNGSDADFQYLNPDNLEGSDFVLPSTNFSGYAENVFNIGKKWSVTPGARFEYISTDAEGYYRIINKDLAGNIINDERIEESKNNDRSLLILGLGLSHRFHPELELYTNFSQNYRAINFNDIRVNVGNLVVDENLSDERGFTFDLGLRGNFKDFLSFDFSGYHISYNDRIGTILRTEPNPVFDGLVDRVVRFRTNIADAKIFGFESLIQLDVIKALQVQNSDYKLTVFSNLAGTSAHYSSSDNTIDGNEVELVPSIVFKTGIEIGWKDVNANFQYGHTAEHFSDASNAIRTPSAIEGIIPSYQVMDLSFSYQYKRWEIETGINNLANELYFTRRATGYPGPGIIPSDGRSFYLTVGIRI